MRSAVWVSVAVLAIVHFDFWLWDNRALVFGFMPIGLAYHAGFSIACGVVWFLAVKYAWPSELEEWASSGPGEEASNPSKTPVHHAAGQASDPFAADEESL